MLYKMISADLYFNILTKRLVTIRRNVPVNVSCRISIVIIWIILRHNESAWAISVCFQFFSEQTPLVLLDRMFRKSHMHHRLNPK